MGSGKKGFNPLPDWSVYALIQVWQNESAPNDFFSNSKLMHRYRTKAFEIYTLYMRNIKSKGEWSGNNPFVLSDNLDTTNPYIAVITRATIKKRLLFKFWSYVPTSQKPLLENDDLIYTKGIGEVPFLQMATFSLWKSKEGLMDFAYKSNEHRKAISDTRTIQWYKEELFSRFQPYKSEGSWSDIKNFPY